MPFLRLPFFRPKLMLLLVVLTAAVFPALAVQNSDALEAGFSNPPPEARLRCYWWWLNGNTNEATISRDLEQMKAKGYGGAILVDAGGAEQGGNRAVPAGPTFGSEAWRRLYRHALEEAARLGLEISLNIQSGWNLGGPTVKPEEGAKLLTWSRTLVHGPAAFHQALERPPERNGFYREIAVLAYPLHHGAALPGTPGAQHPRHPIRLLQIKAAFLEFGLSAPRTEPVLEDYPPAPNEEDARASEVLDLSAESHGGVLTWEAPAGDWEILRIGYTSSDARVSTSSGAWQGLAIDYLDHTALESYWHNVVDPLLADAHPYLGQTLRYLVTDSWELGGVNWTGDFREQFRRLRGYDLLPYLPVVMGRIIESRAASNRFLNDFRRTIGDLVVSQHYAVFVKLAGKWGLGIHPESGGPHGAPLDALETLGVNSFPQTEFWARSATHRTRDEERFFVKEASSAAHIYGKTLVAAEGMTSIGPQWEESIWNDLKPTLDQAFCAGLNRLIWHTFTSSPKEEGLPGQEYFAGTHLNPNVTWWNEAGAFVRYINRSQFLLQQGQPVSDVAYYYGDHVPNFVQVKSADPAKVLPGYDYDVVDEDVLIHGMHFSDGRIRLPGGVSYRVLVLPARENISLDALRAVRDLVSDGAAVVGPKPQRTTGLAGYARDDGEVRAIAEQVWGGCDGASLKQQHFGKGVVYCGQTGREALVAMGISPDFEFRAAAGPGSMDYVHRRSGNADIYFVRNTAPKPLYAEVTFRSRGRLPELWHPDSGRIEQQPVYDFTANGRTRMPLWLEPNGSVFVVFRRPASEHVTQLSRNGNVIFPASAPVADVPDVQVHATDGGFELETQADGRYEARTSTGRTLLAEVSAADPPDVFAGAWGVRFTPGWGAPASARFRTLLSWTENQDPGIRYYSGTATYSKRIFIPAALLAGNEVLSLDLGDVREIARVRLNGQDLGVLWKKPFRVELGTAAKPGTNELQVEVTNLWPNRLIGDQRLPPEKRFTRTNITKFTADSPLMPSGLLGPVELHTAYRVKLEPAGASRPRPGTRK
ncbi:MAG TPA: glycosyl hydrolase [Bryobacteraceae bacterium]|nr:glycosyl hydrolase [Bryobacteraceae bacterium]